MTEEDWRNHNRYKKWLTVYEEMLEQTDTEWGPWTIVEATDKRYTRIKVYETIIQALEERLGIVPGQIGEEEAAAGGPARPPKAPAPKTRRPLKARLKPARSPRKGRGTAGFAAAAPDDGSRVTPPLPRETREAERRLQIEEEDRHA